MIQLSKSKESEEFLKRKIAKEKLKYSNLLRIHEELQSKLSEEKIFKEEHEYSNSLWNHEEPALKVVLMEKIVKQKQKYSDLLGKYEELQSSISLGSGVQTELTRLQTTMESVNINLEKVEAIKNYWGDKV